VRRASTSSFIARSFAPGSVRQNFGIVPARTPRARAGPVAALPAGVARLRSPAGTAGTARRCPARTASAHAPRRRLAAHRRTSPSRCIHPGRRRRAGRHPQRVAGLPYASLEDVADAQLPPDGTGVLAGPLERHGRGPEDDPEPPQPRQRGNQLLRETVTEPDVRGVRAQAVERQHHDGPVRGAYRNCWPRGYGGFTPGCRERDGCGSCTTGRGTCDRRAIRLRPELVRPGGMSAMGRPAASSRRTKRGGQSGRPMWPLSSAMAVAITTAAVS
jgi:hypothetical protein